MLSGWIWRRRQGSIHSLDQGRQITDSIFGKVLTTISMDMLIICKMGSHCTMRMVFPYSTAGQDLIKKQQYEKQMNHSENFSKVSNTLIVTN